MRKIALILAVVLVMSSLMVPAMAAEPKMVTVVPGLTFNGTTATCELRAVGNYLTDDLVATIRLYRGSTLIATWNTEADGYLFFSDTKTVTKGYSYTLKVDLTINGVDFPVADTTKTCS